MPSAKAAVQSLCHPRADASRCHHPRNHQAHSAGHEDRGKRVAHGRADQRGQTPEPPRLVRPPQPLDRQGEHGQRHQQIAAIGLGLGRVAGHRIGDGEQPHGQHQRNALQQSPGHVAEQQQAGQSAQEGNQPQGIFVEAQEFDERQLPPQKQRRSDLAIVQRLEQPARSRGRANSPTAWPRLPRGGIAADSGSGGAPPQRSSGPAAIAVGPGPRAGSPRRETDRGGQKSGGSFLRGIVSSLTGERLANDSPSGESATRATRLFTICTVREASRREKSRIFPAKCPGLLVYMPSGK